MSDVDERIKLVAELERYRLERQRWVSRELSVVSDDAHAPIPRLPPMTPDEEARKLELDDIIRSFERAIERLDASPAAGESQPMIWLGTGAELGRLILDLHAGKKIQASTPTDALRQAARHFVGKDGKRFKETSLMESARSKQLFEEGKRPKQ
jgi:hypothetical protein